MKMDRPTHQDPVPRRETSLLPIATVTPTKPIPHATLLGEVIRKWRVFSELSLDQVAADIGVTRGQLKALETGAYTKGETVMLTVSWLMRRNTEAVYGGQI